MTEVIHIKQSKLESFIEALTQTVVGYVINLGVQLVLYPLYGAVFTFSQNIQIGLVFLVISLFRGYIIRRFFNQRLRVIVKWLARQLTGEK